MVVQSVAKHLVPPTDQHTEQPTLTFANATHALSSLFSPFSMKAPLNLRHPTSTVGIASVIMQNHLLMITFKYYIAIYLSVGSSLRINSTQCQNNTILANIDILP